MRRPRITKSLTEAHGLISGHLRLTKKGHGKAEFRHLAEMRSLFEDRNIVGIGIAEKVSQGKRTRELSLCFYVREKQSKRNLKSNKTIPPVIGIGGRQPVFTDVIETGIARCHANIQDSPIRSGFSVSHIFSRGAGTVGAIVQSGADRYILSNSHVLARNGGAHVGDRIIYPGVGDGPNTGVASLSAFTKLGGSAPKTTDAALAKINADQLGNVRYDIHGAANHPRDILPARGMRIVSSGRTSGIMSSTIRDIDFTGDLMLGGVAINFSQLVVCDRYADVGDSGAIIVDRDSGNILGLHVGGSAEVSYFSPIKNVREGLGMSFDF